MTTPSAPRKIRQLEQALARLSSTERSQAMDWLNDRIDDVKFITSNAYDKLFDHFVNAGMPQGVATASSGDPTRWIYDKLHKLTEVREVQSGRTALLVEDYFGNKGERFYVDTARTERGTAYVLVNYDTFFIIDRRFSNAEQAREYAKQRGLIIMRDDQSPVQQRSQQGHQQDRRVESVEPKYSFSQYRSRKQK